MRALVRRLYLLHSILVVSGLFTACGNASEPSASVTTGDGGTEAGASKLVTESIKLFIDGAALTSVGALPNGDFVAVGTVLEETPSGAPQGWIATNLLVARVPAGTATAIREETGGLLAGALSQDGCDFVQALHPVTFDVDPSGHGVLAGVGICAVQTLGGFAQKKKAFVARYDGQTFTPIHSLPLDGAFTPVRVHCGERGCLLLANRSPNAASPIDKTSATVFRVTDERITIDYDEVANEDVSAKTAVLEPKDIAEKGNEVLIVGMQSSRVSGGIAAPLVRRFDGTTWSAIEGPPNWERVSVVQASASGFDCIGGGQRGSAWSVINGGTFTAKQELGAYAPFQMANVAATRIAVGEAPLSPGYRPVVLSLEDQTEVALPAYRAGSVLAVAAYQDVALGVGVQIAKNGNHPNRNVPLLLRVSTANVGSDDGVLPDEAPTGCSTPADCASEAWGVRCVGHWSCEASQCTPTCDITACGDGTCDSANGETAESCVKDCRRPRTSL